MGTQSKDGSLYDLLVAFLAREDRGSTPGGASVDAMAVSACNRLARLFASEPNARLGRQEAERILREISARGFLAGDPDASALSKRLRDLILSECERDERSVARARRLTNSYVYVLRILFTWGKAHGWPLTEAPIQARGNCDARILQKTSTSRKGGNQTSGLYEEPYGYYPWTSEDKKLRARLIELPQEISRKTATLARMMEDLKDATSRHDIRAQTLSKAVHMAQLELDRMRRELQRLPEAIREREATRWLPCLQGLWDAYEAHLNDPLAGGRRRRPATIRAYYGALGRYAGYLINTNPPIIRKNELTEEAFWEALVDRDDRYLEGFARWLIARHRRIRNDENYIPAVVHEDLLHIGRLVRHYWYPHVAPETRHNLPPRDIKALALARKLAPATRIKDNSLPLPTIAQVLDGVDITDRAVGRSLGIANEDEETLGDSQDVVVLACRSAVDLAGACRDATVIRAMMAFPLRQKNWREARLNKNISRSEDGKWYIRFGETETKTWRTLAVQFDPRNPAHSVLCDRLDRYFGKGRYETTYKQMGIQSPWTTLVTASPTYGTLESDSDVAFPSVGGKVMSASSFRNNICDWTYATIGVRVDPHLCRDIVATTILKSDPREVLVVAMLLGDSVEMVLKHYSHLTQQHGIQRASALIYEINAAERRARAATDTSNIVNPIGCAGQDVRIFSRGQLLDACASIGLTDEQKVSLLARLRNNGDNGSETGGLDLGRQFTTSGGRRSQGRGLTGNSRPD